MKKFSILVIVLIFLLPNLASAEEIIIFHTNDMHCRILNTDDGGKSIGLAEMSRNKTKLHFGLTRAIIFTVCRESI